METVKSRRSTIPEQMQQGASTTRKLAATIKRHRNRKVGGTPSMPRRFCPLNEFHVLRVYVSLI